MKTFELILNIIIALGGLGAFITYFWQKKARTRDAAALVVTQIEELKDKILEINDIAVDGKLNETEFYETLDIITDNQWEKYRHVFIKKIDSYSYRTINKFYDCALGIREQLLFVKQLQHNQYFNIQGMLDTNCNKFILDGMSYVEPNLSDLKKYIDQIETKNDEDKKIKDIVNSMLLESLKINITQDMKHFFEIYNSQKSKIVEITNSNVYINYIPTQVYLTISKLINNINSIEVIGCTGYKKLKKIARIK
ncbi:MAG: hypothetical protein J1F35_04270 [Erysipelotrichales bacterium]|nr:hypothetical protein [Erysipelotrichales bacterium]